MTNTLPTTGADASRYLLGAAPTPAAPNAANILAGYQSLVASGGPTTVITIPAGRTWAGVVALSVSCSEDAAGVVRGQVQANMSVAGAGASPPAGNIFGANCFAGANAAGGTAGSEGQNTVSAPLIVAAPAANAVTIQVTGAIGASIGRIDASAVGVLY